MRRKRFALAAGVAAVLAVAAVAVAAGAGSSARVEIVRGRVFDYELAYKDGTTKFRDLIVENALPGSNVALTVLPPCDPKGTVHQQTTPATGIVDFSSVARRYVLRTHCQVLVGLSDADRLKLVRYTAHDRRPPTSTRTCSVGDGPSVTCSALCPPSGNAPADLCQGAGEPVVQSPVGYHYTGYPGHLRFTRLVATHPAGSILSLRCRGSSCPIFDKVVYAPLAGNTNLAHFLGRRLLRAGTTIQVWIEKENAIGRVAVFKVSRRTVTHHQLCLPQAALTPEPCG